MYIKLPVCFLLAFFIIHSQSFTFVIGNFSIISQPMLAKIAQERSMNVERNHTESPYTIRLAMFLFPFNVYEYRLKSNKDTISNNYLFVKLNYTKNISHIFSDKNNPNLYHGIDQYDKLYSTLPQAAVFRSDHNQYLQLIIIDQPLIKRFFAIKNMTNYHLMMPKFYDIYLFNLDIQSFLRKYITQSIKQITNQVFPIEQSILRAQNITYDQLLGNQTLQNIFFLKNINKLKNITWINLEQLHHILFYSHFKERILESTKWTIQSDAFNIYFVYADIKKDEDYIDFVHGASSESVISTNKHKKKEESLRLQINLLVYYKRKVKRVDYLSESLFNLNLTSFKYFQLALYPQSTVLLIADDYNYYILDVSDSKWHLSTYNPLPGDQLNVLLGYQYGAIFIQNDTIRYSQNSKKRYYNNHKFLPKVQFGNEIIWSKDISRQYLLVCFSDDNCSLYEKKLLKLVQKVNVSMEILQKSKVEISLQFNNTEIVPYLDVYDRNNPNISAKYQLKSIPLINNYKNQSKSIFINTIYPIQTYRNVSFLKQQEINKLIYEYFNLMGNKYQNTLNTSYFSFLQYIKNSEQNNTTNESCYSLSNSTTNNLIYILNNNKWDACIFKYQTKSLIQFKLSYNLRANYDIYVCHDHIDDISIVNTKCELYDFQLNVKTNDQITDYQYLRKERLYKFFIFKGKKQYTNVKMPVLAFKDIEKQIYQFGESIFYVALMTLSFSLLFLICLIIMRPIVRTSFIYFGITNPAAQPNYPLSWINLKIKIKRLKKMGYLKYVTYNVTQGQTEQNDCCFCLQPLKNSAKLAELYCLHSFHAECFNEWIRNEPNNRCPKCRREFTRAQLQQFQNNRQIAQEIV